MSTPAEPQPELSGDRAPDPRLAGRRNRRIVLATAASEPRFGADHPLLEPILSRRRHVDRVRATTALRQWLAKNPPADVRELDLRMRAEDFMPQDGGSVIARVSAAHSLVVYRDRSALIVENLEDDHFRPFPVIMEVEGRLTVAASGREAFIQRDLMFLRSRRSHLAVPLEGPLNSKVPELDATFLETVRSALRIEVAAWVAAMEQAAAADRARAELADPRVEVWPPVFLGQEGAVSVKTKAVLEDLSILLALRVNLLPRELVLHTPGIPQDGSFSEHEWGIGSADQAMSRAQHQEVEDTARRFLESLPLDMRPRFRIVPPVMKFWSGHPNLAALRLPWTQPSFHRRLELMARYPALFAGASTAE